MATKAERLEGTLQLLRIVMMDLAKEQINHKAEHTDKDWKQVGKAFESVQDGFNTLYDLSRKGR